METCRLLCTQYCRGAFTLSDSRDSRGRARRGEGIIDDVAAVYGYFEVVVVIGVDIR
jgi:hypothetical protein